MFVAIILLVSLVYVSTITYVSYRLGVTKTENPKLSALVGFLLAFLPPLALIYLVVLLLRDEVSLV